MSGAPLLFQICWDLLPSAAGAAFAGRMACMATLRLALLVVRSCGVGLLKWTIDTWCLGTRESKQQGYG